MVVQEDRLTITEEVGFSGRIGGLTSPSLLVSPPTCRFAMRDTWVTKHLNEPDAGYQVEASAPTWHGSEDISSPEGKGGRGQQARSHAEDHRFLRWGSVSDSRHWFLYVFPFSGVCEVLVHKEQFSWFVHRPAVRHLAKVGIDKPFNHVMKSCHLVILYFRFYSMDNTMFSNECNPGQRVHLLLSPPQVTSWSVVVVLLLFICFLLQEKPTENTGRRTITVVRPAHMTEQVLMLLIFVLC